MATDYFQFQLKNQLNLVIPLEQVAEVLTLPRSEICPIPGVNQALLGVINQRGQLLWIVDLNQLLNQSPLQQLRQSSPKLTVIVVSANDKKIGCLVSKLQGIATQDELDFSSSQELDLPAIDQPLIISQSESLNFLNIEAIFTAIQQEGKREKHIIIP